DSSEPSNDNTNAANALQEAFVVNQDPSKNSSQSPPQINHHCCYECGDPLEDIFCHQCAYGNSFTYDSTPNFVRDSPNIFNPPLQPQTHSYEFWSPGDKIICDLDKTPDLSQRPPQNCPKCGNPVNDAFEPFNDNTNVVNALQEPFVVKEDPGENSSQSPPQINHYCYYGCGDPLEDIFCHQCTCKLCGRGAHYGNNCPPKFLVVPDPEPFNNQTVDELPQTVSSFYPTWYSEDGNSFTYDSTSNLVHDSPNFPVIHQPIREKTCAELLAKEQEANIDTQPFQYSVIPQPPQEEMSVEFLQEKRNQIDYVKTFLRKLNRIFLRMPKVLSLAWETILEIELAFEDKHCQPEDILELFKRLYNDEQNIPRELADYAIAVIPSLSTEEPDNSLSIGDKHLDTVSATESDEFIKSGVENLVSIPSESEGIPDNMCDVPFHDNSPPLDNVEASPPNSELVSSEVIEIVIPKVGGIDDDILLTIKDDILRKKLLNVNLFIANIEALNDNPTPSFDFMTKSSSTSLNSLLEETNTFDNSLPEFEIFCFDLEEISSGSTTTRFDISLPEYEAFYDDHVKEISSGSTTTHSDSSLYDSFIFDLLINPFSPTDRSDFYEFADELAHIISLPDGSTTTHSDSSLYDSFIFDLLINPFPPADRSDFYEFADEIAHIISPPEYDCFCFKNEPNSGDFTMDVVEDIFPTREPRVHNDLPTHPTFQLNQDFILSSESLFTYVVWIFLLFLSYSVAPQYLLSFGNEDTIFNPGICSYHIFSFMPDVSHRTLADMGASINLMPLSIWKKLSLPELTPTQMILELAGRSTTRPAGIAEDVFVKLGKFHFPTDFVVVDYVVDPRVPLILRRPFFRTGRALIDVYGEELTLRVDDKAITFKVGQTSKYSYNDAKSINQIDVINVAYEEYVQEVLGFLEIPKSGNPTLTSKPIIASFSPSCTPFEGSDFI
nr:reverse transcriptase domain-containing protein [Tanacetum cinerariifolium]